MPLTLKPFEQVLIGGNKRALLNFGECENCVVIDWRDEVPEILADIRRMLPKGYFEFQRVDTNQWELRCGGVPRVVSFPRVDGSEPVLGIVNRALMPEYEMRIFKPTIGDAYSLLLRPTTWWQEFGASYPQRLQRLFVTIDERLSQVQQPPGTGRLYRWNQKWMGLRGWQRGVLGTLIIVGAIFLIITAVAAVFTYIVP